MRSLSGAAVVAFLLLASPASAQEELGDPRAGRDVIDDAVRPDAARLSEPSFDTSIDLHVAGASLGSVGTSVLALGLGATLSCISAGGSNDCLGWFLAAAGGGVAMMAGITTLVFAIVEHAVVRRRAAKIRAARRLSLGPGGLAIRF